MDQTEARVDLETKDLPSTNKAEHNFLQENMGTHKMSFLFWLPLELPICPLGDDTILLPTLGAFILQHFTSSGFSVAFNPSPEHPVK